MSTTGAVPAAGDTDHISSGIGAGVAGERGRHEAAQALAAVGTQWPAQ